VEDLYIEETLDDQSIAKISNHDRMKWVIISLAVLILNLKIPKIIFPIV